MTTTTTGWLKSFPKEFWIRELGVRFALLAVTLAIFYLLPPFQRRVQPEKWYKYRFPYATSEAFPILTTGVILIVMPVLNMLFILWCLRKRFDSTRRIRMGVIYLLAVSLSILLTLFACETIKRLYGRPRPDFLSRCLGVLDPNELVRLSNSFVNDDPPDCSASRYSKAVIRDGRMSFPSAHSALAFAVASIMAIWDFIQMKNIPNSGAEILVVPVLLLVPALVISLSRTSDYRHHTTDVLAGILLGTIISAGCCYVYFPGRASRRGQPGGAFTISLDALDKEDAASDTEFAANAAAAAGEEDPIVPQLGATYGINGK